MKKVLFISDPLEKISPKEDTTLAFLRECQKQGFESYWTWSERVSWFGHETRIKGQKVLRAKEQKLPLLEENVEILRLEEFAFVFIRKDPPFNESYLRLCWMLAPYEKDVKFFNRPSALVRYHEKIVQLEALRQGDLEESQVLSTLIADDYATTMDYVNLSKASTFVIKPWLGYGGRDIQKLSKEDFAKKAKPLFQEDQSWMIQPFVEEIAELGDRRVLFSKGRYLGDFVRLPAEGQFVSNLSQGGSAILRELSAEEGKTVRALEKFLQREKIDFAGADLIGSYVNEVNITSPTGVVTWDRLTNKNCAATIIDDLLRS